MSTDQKTYTILIADDDAGAVERYRIALEKDGFRVVSASNGAAALMVAKKEHPDLIIMDLKMPVLDGLDASMMLKEDPDTKNTKIIFLTALGKPEEHEKIAKAYGVQDFISKDVVSADEFLKKVREHLNIR